MNTLTTTLCTTLLLGTAALTTTNTTAAEFVAADNSPGTSIQDLAKLNQQTILVVAGSK